MVLVLFVKRIRHFQALARRSHGAGALAGPTGDERVVELVVDLDAEHPLTNLRGVNIQNVNAIPVHAEDTANRTARAAFTTARIVSRNENDIVHDVDVNIVVVPDVENCNVDTGNSSNNDNNDSYSSRRADNNQEYATINNSNTTTSQQL
jgi:hypothetical protein